MCNPTWQKKNTHVLFCGDLVRKIDAGRRHTSTSYILGTYSYRGINRDRKRYNELPGIIIIRGRPQISNVRVHLRAKARRTNFMNFVVPHPDPELTMFMDMARPGNQRGVVKSKRWQILRKDAARR